jgi:hypothetical protein
MHPLSELIQRSSAFNLSVLGEASDRTIEALQTSAATPLVKMLQMIQLQKAIMAIGMFSMFEANLQDGLEDGFREAAQILDAQGQSVLRERLVDFHKAVNVLKHGRGRSYDALVNKAASLPFRLKMPAQKFFNEGDVSEISTLVEVDDKFVEDCATVIYDVSAAIRRAKPNYFA